MVGLQLRPNLADGTKHCLGSVGLRLPSLFENACALRGVNQGYSGGLSIDYTVHSVSTELLGAAEVSTFLLDPVQIRYSSASQALRVW